jgi:hypothetical protein
MIQSLKLNSVTVVRKQTIPTERPPLVGEAFSENLIVINVMKKIRIMESKGHKHDDEVSTSLYHGSVSSISHSHNLGLLSEHRIH